MCLFCLLACIWGLVGLSILCPGCGLGFKCLVALWLLFVSVVG